jgi:hypothetical protein
VVERESRTFLLVDTGPWIFGKTIKLPAGLVAGVDPEQGIVLVDRPKDDIKNAPEPDGDLHADAAHDDALAHHYAGGAHDAAPSVAPSAPPGPPAATALGGIAPPDTGAAEGPSPADAGPALEEREADRDDDGAPTPEPAPALDAPAPSTPEPQAAEPAGAGDDGAPGATEAPEPSTPEPSADDAPSALAGLVPQAPPEVEERAPEQPEVEERAPEQPEVEQRVPEQPPPKEKPAPERARRRAEAPSRAKPARKRKEAPSRAKSEGTATAAKTRARGDSAPAPAKRPAPSGASARNDQPLARYDALTAAEVVARLRALTQTELAKLERYEKRGEGRQTILKRVASLREKEPWRGYDTATVKEVRERLARAKADRVTAVRDYERRHRNRTGVMEAARRRLDSM